MGPEMKAAFAFVGMILVLAGCATPFEYRPAPGEQTAKLKLGVPMIPFVNLSENEGCPKKQMDVQKAETIIPANKRQWVEPGYSSAGVPGGSECVIPLSFVPRAGKEYFVVFERAGQTCNARVLTRNDAGRLVIDPSLKREKYHLCMI